MELLNIRMKSLGKITYGDIKLDRIVWAWFQNGILDKKEKEFLVPLAPTMPIIYYLPKVHKCLTKPTGRPIVSGIDSLTSCIGKYVKVFLEPLVSKAPAYLRDTTHMIDNLSQIVLEGDVLLVTVDV